MFFSRSKKGVSDFALSLLTALCEKYKQEWLTVRDQSLEKRLVLLNNPLFLAPDCWFDEAGLLQAKKQDEACMRGAFANPGGMAHREPYKDFKLAIQARLAGDAKKPLFQYTPKELIDHSANHFLLNHYIEDLANNPDPLLFALLLSHAHLNDGLIKDRTRYVFAIKKALEDLKAYCNQEEGNQEHYEQYKIIVIEMAAYLSHAYRDVPTMLADLSGDYREMVSAYKDGITARIKALNDQEAILAFIEFVKTCDKKDDLLALFNRISFAKVLGAACDGAGNGERPFQVTVGERTISAAVLKQTRLIWLPLYLEQQTADPTIRFLLNNYFVLLQEQDDQQIIPVLINFMKTLPTPSRLTSVVDFVRASFVGGDKTVTVEQNFFLPAPIVQQMRSVWLDAINFAPYKNLLEPVLGELFVAVLQQQDDAAYQRFSAWVKQQALQLMPHSDTNNYEQILQYLCAQLFRADISNAERKKIFSYLQDIFLPRIQLEKTKRLDVEKPITPLVTQALVEDGGLMIAVLTYGDLECAQALVEWIKALQMDLSKFLESALKNCRALVNPTTLTMQARILDGWISALDIRVKSNHWYLMSDEMKAELSKFGRSETNSEFHTVNIVESFPADLSEEQKILFRATFQNRSFDVFVERTKAFLLTRSTPNSQAWFAVFQKIVKEFFLALLLEQLVSQKPAVKKAARDALYQLIQLWPDVRSVIVAMVKNKEDSIEVMGTAYLAQTLVEDAPLQKLFTHVIPASEKAVRDELKLADTGAAASSQVAVVIDGYRFTLDRTITIKEAEQIIKQNLLALQPFFESLRDYLAEENIAEPRDLWSFVFSGDRKDSLLAGLLKSFQSTTKETSWSAILLLQNFIRLWPEIIIAFGEKSAFLKALETYPDLHPELERADQEKRKNHPVKFSATYSLHDALEIGGDKANQSIDQMLGVFTEGMQTIADLDNADCFSVATQTTFVPKEQPVAAPLLAHSVAAASAAPPPAALIAASSAAAQAAAPRPSSEEIQQAYSSQTSIMMMNHFLPNEDVFKHFNKYFENNKKYTRDWSGINALVKDLESFMAITFAFGQGPFHNKPRIAMDFQSVYTLLKQKISDVFAQLIINSIIKKEEYLDFSKAIRTLIALCPSILIMPIKLNPAQQESAKMLPVDFAKYCGANDAFAVLKSLEVRPCKSSQDIWSAVAPSFQKDITSTRPVDFIAWLYEEILKKNSTVKFDKRQPIILNFAQAGLIYAPSREQFFDLEQLLRYGCFDRLMELYLAAKLANQDEQEGAPQAAAAGSDNDQPQGFYPGLNNF